MRAALVLALAAAAACDRTSRPPPVARDGAPAARDSAPAATAPTPVVVAPDAAGCDLTDVPARRPAASRVIAIGDLHGDLQATRAALRTARVIDADDHWTGGKAVVVQTGDLLDRGDDEQAIIELFEQLEVEAAAAGGAVVWLLGNHELMNAAGDLRYVTPGGFTDFADVKSLDLAGLDTIPEAVRARVAAFRPGGAYARILAGQNTVAIVGDTVFVHAGIVGQWATRIDEVNRGARCWLAGQGDEPDALSAQDGPVWTRAYGFAAPDCAAAREALAALGVKRMVVGHTTQERGIDAACAGAVWRIDVGLARFYMGPIEVLELAPGAAPRVLRGKRLP